MINVKDWLEFGQKFHGHKCPAMPMGLRVGAAAMNKLGVNRTGDGDIIVILDLGEDHCVTCYANGKEYYRHVGYFPEKDVVKILQQKGVKK